MLGLVQMMMGAPVEYVVLAWTEPEPGTMQAAAAEIVLRRRMDDIASEWAGLSDDTRALVLKWIKVEETGYDHRERRRA